MSWIEISFCVEAAQAEPMEQQLWDLGAWSVTYLDAEHTRGSDILEPKPGAIAIWAQTKLVGLFEATAPIDKILPQLTVSTPIHVQKLEDKIWEREWMQYFKPLCFGQALWICPSGYPLPDPQGIAVHLDPGLAFGTGTHPTTALCLDWLALHLLPQSRVLDYGCGSGILGISAKKLGAAQVIAVDYDPQAIRATLDNAGQNGLSADDLQAYLPEHCPPLAVDLILANILAGPLVELAPLLSTALLPEGTLVLSGLLETQIQAVQHAYPEISFDTPVLQEGWARLVGKKSL